MKISRIVAAIALIALAGQSVRTFAATVAAVYNFSGPGDGAQPYAGLCRANDGSFYGTTYGGGIAGLGTVYKISSTGAFTELYNFGGADGAQPYGQLVQGIDSNFYGTTYAGGLGGSGTVFKITAGGSLTRLYSFTGTGDGAQPYAGLCLGSDGIFYGTTYAGGTSGSGTVFKVSSNGAYARLHSFAGSADGGSPSGALVQGADGGFYGTTYYGGGNNAGTVFKISSSSTFTRLRSFTGGTDGGGPLGGLVEGNDGNFYGTTYAGGGAGAGTVFKITPSGAFTRLYSLNGGSDGSGPAASLIQGGDGDFYGTAFYGGANGGGTVFRVSPSGTFTRVYSFTGGYDGAYPFGGVVQTSVSNFFGTATAGGSGSAGTVFGLIQPCTFTLSPSRVTLPAVSSSGTIAVTASGTNCPWTASSNADWITITAGDSGTGNGMVAYSVPPNTNAAARDGTINISGKSFTVTQQAAVLGQFLQGTYNGLVLQEGVHSNASSGFINLKLKNTGAYSAKLTVGGVSCTFKGQFDGSGNATNTVTRKNLSPLQVVLQLLPVTNKTDQITGTVSGDTFTSDLLADLAVFTNLNPCPWAGTYTLLLVPADSSDSEIPQGYGYATLTVSTTGSARLQGVLGDGTKVNVTTPVSGYGTWPFCKSLYKNQGSCIGWVTFATNGTLEATFDWFKPAVATDHYYPSGFTTTLTLEGATYISPSSGGPSVAGDWQLTLSDGNLPSNIVKSVTVAASGTTTVTPSGTEKVTLQITPTKGSFSGSFLNPASNRTTKFKGLLLQQPYDAGGGCFQGTNESGSVELLRVP